MGGKRKKPAIPKVYKPTTQLVGEDEGVVWVGKKAKHTVIPESATAQAKAETKTVRPDVRAYYPIYSDTLGAWQADLMFIPYTNKATETRLHAFLCMVNINTKWAFVRQCNFDGKKNEDKEFLPKGKNQKVSVGAGGDVYGITVSGNAKSAQKTKTQFQNIFTKDIPEATKEVQQLIPTFKGFQVNTIYTDDGGEFKGVCHDYLEESSSKNKEGISKINHVVFAPSTGTKRRLGVVERFNRTFREKYVFYVKELKAAHAAAKDLYFPTAIPAILEDYNYRDDHRAIKEFITRKTKKGDWYFTKKFPSRLKGSKAPIHMLLPGYEEEFIKWKKLQTKKVDSIQKDRIDTLKNTDKVQFFKGLFTAKNRSKKKGDEVLNLRDQFMKSGTGNLSDVVNLVGQYKYRKRGGAKIDRVGKSYVVGDGENPTLRLMPYDLIPVFK